MRSEEVTPKKENNIALLILAVVYFFVETSEMRECTPIASLAFDFSLSERPFPQSAKEDSSDVLDIRIFADIAGQILSISQGHWFLDISDEVYKSAFSGM